jgi:hypothetical protein
LATGRLWGTLRDGVSRCTKRRYGGTLAVAAGSIQVPLCTFAPGADHGCRALLQRRSRSKIAFLFGELGFVALFLGLLVEYWKVEMCIRICLSWCLLRSILISPLFSKYSSRRLPLVMRSHQSVLKSAVPA